MKKECVRRLKALGVPEEIITKFENEGVVPRLDSFYRYTDVSEEDVARIKELEEEGKKVYLIIQGFYEGVLMTNYLVVTQFENEWGTEFYKSIPHCYVGYAYVMSERTHDVFDAGMINLFCTEGWVERVTAEDAYAMVYYGEA